MAQALTKLGTPIVKGTDFNITLAGLASGDAAGRISSRIDLGALSAAALRTSRFRFYFETRWPIAPTVGGTVDFYLGPWDDDVTPGRSVNNIGAADAAFASGAANVNFSNWQKIGNLYVPTATANAPFSFHNPNLYIPYRYVTLGVVNRGGQALDAVEANTICVFTPVIDEIT
jgi:hypothetical protein